MVDWSPRPLGTRMVGRSPKAKAISIKGWTRARAVSLAGRPLLQSVAPEARLSASLLRALRQTEMGPSGFEPESSGPEPPRIDQATPRTRATRGRCGVCISIARDVGFRRPNIRGFVRPVEVFARVSQIPGRSVLAELFLQRILSD